MPVKILNIDVHYTGFGKLTSFSEYEMPYEKGSLLIKKLYGLSPRANYTDRATAACRRSDCQLFADRGCHVISVTDPWAVFSVF
jgi:hypothetical protein